MKWVNAMLTIYEIYLKLLNIIDVFGIDKLQILKELELLMAPVVDEIIAVDERYLVYHKKGSKERILLTASIADPYVFVVKQIMNEGLIEFSELYNRLLPSFIIGTKVKFQNGVIGVIYTKFKDSIAGNISFISADKLYIDIGVYNCSVAKTHLHIGDCAIINGLSYEQLKNRITGPHLSVLITTALLLKTIKIFGDFATDLYFIISSNSKHDLGDLIKNIVPDYIINIETYTIEDFNSNKHEQLIKSGKGPIIEYPQINKYLSNFTEMICQTANENGINIQRLFLAPSEKSKKCESTIRIPIFHALSATEIVDNTDVDKLLNLLQCIIFKIQREGHL